MDPITPNLIAYGALLTWPFVAFYLYSALPLGRATVWTILAGYLLLPVLTEIKFEMVPPLNKETIPNLGALFACVALTGRWPKLFRSAGLPELLILLLLFSPFITSMLNSDPIVIGDTTLPGVGAYDAGSATLAQFIFILPFFLGRQFLRSAESTADILRALTIAGLAYSLPMLFEFRMSPQLHTWIYGYFPNNFAQQVRDGGFRAVVFLGHGLIVAFFAMTTTVAAAAMWRTKTRIAQLTPSLIAGYLTIILILCKTLSALLYATALVPLVRWTSPRLQLRVASVCVILTLGYPVLRALDLIPTAPLVQVANSLSADRGQSLETRFLQEDQLMAHAWQRPWFGWGRFGRNRVYNGYEGRDSSITDGRWIITMGQFGMVGFFAEFGLLALPVVRAASALQFAQSTRDSVYLAALALILAIAIVDLLPNGFLTSWTWLLAGALLGRAEDVRATARIPSGFPRATPTMAPLAQRAPRLKHGP